MKIGELSTKTGVSRDTIRFYERSGLLVNVTRPFEWNNYKDYGNENLKRIQILKCLKKFGFTLKEGKEIIEEKERDINIDAYRRKKAGNKLQEIDDKIQELIQIKENLEQLLNK